MTASPLPHRLVVEPITSYAALLAASGDDPFVQYDVRPEAIGPAFRCGGGVGFVRGRPSGGRSLTLMGDAGEVEAMLAAGPDLAGLDSVSVPLVLVGLLAAYVEVGAGGNWEWMWTRSTPPPITGEDEVLVLDAGSDGAEILDLLEASSPRAGVYPADGRAHRWVGVRAGDGTLVACGAAERTSAGAPHLAGIASHPAYRGRGLGVAVTAALTRFAVLTEGVCTLGMYADNAIARRVYEGLGYHNDHAWASRRILS